MFAWVNIIITLDYLERKGLSAFNKFQREQSISAPRGNGFLYNSKLSLPYCELDSNYLSLIEFLQKFKSHMAGNCSKNLSFAREKYRNYTFYFNVIIVEKNIVCIIGKLLLISNTLCSVFLSAGFNTD